MTPDTKSPPEFPQQQTPKLLGANWFSLIVNKIIDYHLSVFTFKYKTDAENNPESI